MFYNPAELVNEWKEKGYLKDGDSVADFGCGSGYFTIALAGTVGEGACYAFDILAEPLSAVKSLARKTGIANALFQQANLELPGATALADGSVQFVLIGSMLYQAGNRQAVLREAARILAPGGYCAIVEWIPEKRIYADNSGIPKAEALNIAIAAGLRIVEERELRYHYVVVVQKNDGLRTK